MCRALVIALFPRRASQVGLVLKNSPANAGDMRLSSWVRKIPLEEDMATHYSILAWSIPWTEEPGGLHGVTKRRT